MTSPTLPLLQNEYVRDIVNIYMDTRYVEKRDNDRHHNPSKVFESHEGIHACVREEIRHEKFVNKKKD